jgi:hypothetical protein
MFCRVGHWLLGLFALVGLQPESFYDQTRFFKSPTVGLFSELWNVLFVPWNSVPLFLIRTMTIFCRLLPIGGRKLRYATLWGE